MSCLTEFLLARIAEDQAVDPLYYNVGAGRTRVERAEPSPRWLRECEAKRRIVERHSACDDVSYGDASTCPDMRDLAAVYSDHPDYRQEWKP